jgi:hypothetical protein
MGDSHENWVETKPNRMKINKINEIVEILRVRGENQEYIISYLTKIISGLEAVAPKPVKGYLDVTIHNMTPVKEATYAHS